MWELSENSLVTFFAGEAQMFGALLGLLGLSFVRGADIIERNFSQHLTNLVTELMKAIEKVEGSADLNVSLKSNEELGIFIDRYRDKIAPEKFQHIQYQFRELKREADQKKALSRRFRLNCWFSFFMIAASSAAMMIPVAQFPLLVSYAAVGLFLISLVALVMATLFFIEITKTTSVFIYGQ